MTRKINLSIIILCIIETICCFTPFCLDEEYWKYKQSIAYHGISSLERHNDISIFENDALLGKPLAVVFVSAAIVVAVIYFLKALNFATNLTNKAWIFAIVHSVAMVVFLLYSCSIAEVDNISYRYEYGMNWMFYIIIALNLIVLTLAILQKMGKVDEMPIKKQVVAKESANDLMSYKELLDSGVISQKEFDAKKKQILGL